LIPEVDRYQGVVLRQLLVAQPEGMRIGVVNLSGRIDAYSIERAAIQIKYCTKRLSPWQFTYLRENLAELEQLRANFDPVWSVLVCGHDGVVGLSLGELRSIIQAGAGGAAWVRVSRSRNTMYRVAGTLGELPRAKPRGLDAFVTQVLHEFVAR